MKGDIIRNCIEFDGSIFMTFKGRAWKGKDVKILNTSDGLHRRKKKGKEEERG